MYLIGDVSLGVDAPPGQVDEVVFECVEVVDGFEWETDRQNVVRKLDAAVRLHQSHVGVNLLVGLHSTGCGVRSWKRFC